MFHSACPSLPLLNTFRNNKLADQCFRVLAVALLAPTAVTLGTKARLAAAQDVSCSDYSFTLSLISLFIFSEDSFLCFMTLFAE